MRRLQRLPAWSVAAALAALYLLLDPPSADLAAQTYRTWLFENAPWGIWDNGWYGGHHLPAYSILFPPLAALIGPRVVGALSAVAAAWCFERLVSEPPRPGSRGAALWFAAGTSVSLITGRLTFALGVAFACGAALAIARRRTAPAVALAALTALASPVAGAFLALLVAAWSLVAGRRGTAVAVAAAAVVPSLVLGLAFPEGGTFPFVASAFWPSLAATLALLALLPRDERVVRAGVAASALLLVVAFVVESPMGGNAVRLGALLAGPVAVLALWPRRRVALLLLVPALLYWQWQTPVDDWVRASGDPSVEAPFYEDLAAFFESRPGGAFRVEVPFTDNHWEASLLARHVPLARGWERQVDRKVNPLFYDDEPLTPARYHAWLRENAIRYVALADAPIDYSAAEEAALVRAGQPYLREVWRDEHWRVFEVRDARPMADGATVTRIGIDDLDLVAPRPGRVVVRVRWTPYWKLEGLPGCVSKAGEWTAVDLRRAGRARLKARFAVDRVRATSPRCTSGR